MPEKHLFEYAILRIVPCVEREEFLNVGVILYCPSLKFLKAIFHLNESRLSLFTLEVGKDELEERLSAFAMICEGDKQSGPIGNLPMASRFRWLTATRSTVVQTSKVHPGLCVDPEKTLNQLHESLVL